MLPFRAGIAALVLALAFAGCVLGPEHAPGCADDSDCDDGFTCRAGACMSVTTSRSPPHEGADAGDAG